MVLPYLAELENSLTPEMMKVAIMIWIMLFFIGSNVKCSTILNDHEKSTGSWLDHSIRYEGRFNKIEPFSGIDLHESQEAFKKCTFKSTGGGF